MLVKTTSMAAILAKSGRLGMVGVLLSIFVAGTAQARTLETAFGDVDVEGTPERVVTLYEGALDAAVAAGVNPLGAVTTRGGDNVASYIEAHLGENTPAIMGVVREINIEAVLAQQPDLILAPAQLSDEQYQLLSRIAPTVVPPTQPLAPDNWKDEARLYGEALNRQAAIAEAIEAVEQRAAEVAEAVEEAGVGGSAFLVRWMPGGPMVMSENLFAAGLLAQAGLDVQDAGLVGERGVHSDVLSLENLSQVDGDWLFLATLNEDGQAAVDAAKQSSAFTRLNVVQQDHVVPVDGQLWTSANGPLAAQAILDDIEAALLP
ncbi:putative siderophore-binding lipoprotein yfiY [Halomonas sp. A3H3]|jgi:iron complex transport system substrate-binding protein|uniref:ABC transporter substrate-binding protein n=2 Tax=Oceanospirillales TaxID=135619 RepID=UPI00038D40D9|nr:MULTISPECIES: ABC transporter substrate-binding protein [Halomonas]CAD5252090.1 putative siderophore-binding lipoprotein yfiY [Halomonas sp. 113]CAD5252160.1 putative siderophore-binding lipoprotein yfiY [Halomonas sp. 59]CAD5259604.1 Putative siderophore-binding lipoprotein yfiY [Halomonas sp. I3]CAD5295574.1 putative siderophore-binding lipoprotein yfiY [Halomonas sp. 156]CDG54063.1 putative siderophore-binding lipoprotein yfiY [Halomonas sp. A3H3]|tara:strand:- start:34906 stop:35862 length:957 start_codon:yes stop_codon:yes gene_type:complete